MANFVGMEIAIVILAVALIVAVAFSYKISSDGHKAVERVRAEGERLRQAEAQKAEEVRRAEAMSAERRIAELKEAHQQQLEREREATGERFKALAAEVLQSNTRLMDERSRMTLEAALAPMRTTFAQFTKDFQENYSIENRERLSLREEIRSLHELNTQVGRETSRLTSALKGNTSVQGRWGEMMLANILEHSGLQQGRWFVTQESTTTEEGSRLRPDAVIHCPGERDIIIDSKVSLTHYLNMLNAETPDERAALTKAHLQSVENHVKELRNKEYQNRIGARKGDFVLMFMPHEGAYLEAMNASPELWMKAYDSHVIIVSPTHLVTVVRLVEQMWQSEDQSVNAQRIAEQGQAMIDSVNSFLKDMDNVGAALAKARDSFDSARRRLESGNNNVLRVAGRLRELGVKGKKEP